MDNMVGISERGDGCLGNTVGRLDVRLIGRDSVEFSQSAEDDALVIRPPMKKF